MPSIATAWLYGPSAAGAFVALMISFILKQNPFPEIGF